MDEATHLVQVRDVIEGQFGDGQLADDLDCVVADVLLQVTLLHLERTTISVQCLELFA